MVPNSRYMQRAGLEDPREDFIRFLARVGRPLLYRPDAERFGLPEWEHRLIEVYYDNAARAVAHLEDIGALRTAHQPEWASYNDLPEDRGRFGRVIFNVDDDGELTNGRGAIDRLLAHARSAGVDRPSRAPGRRRVREPARRDRGGARRTRSVSARAGRSSSPPAGSRTASAGSVSTSTECTWVGARRGPARATSSRSRGRSGSRSCTCTRLGARPSSTSRRSKATRR